MPEPLEYSKNFEAIGTDRIFRTALSTTIAARERSLAELLASAVPLITVMTVVAFSGSRTVLAWHPTRVDQWIGAGLVITITLGLGGGLLALLVLEMVRQSRRVSVIEIDAIGFRERSVTPPILDVFSVDWPIVKDVRVVEGRLLLPTFRRECWLAIDLVTGVTRLRLRGRRPEVVRRVFAEMNRWRTTAADDS